MPNAASPRPSGQTRAAGPRGSAARRATEPREAVQQLERAPRLPDGDGARFRGYGVMGVSLASGHVLALRRFPASSVGPGYTSVWHRDAGGGWTFYADVPPHVSCAHYFGGTDSAAVVDRITVTWTGPRSFTVVVDGARLAWTLHLRATTWTRAMSAVAAALPERVWRRPRALAVLGAVTGRVLDAGQLALSGRSATGYRFRAVPKRLWLVDASTALLDGRSLGLADDAAPQSRRGDFWIPRRGVFVIGEEFCDLRRDAPGAGRTDG